MTDRINKTTDPSVDPQGAPELPDVESVNHSGQRDGGMGQDDLDRRRDPAGADSTEQVTRRGPSNVEGL